MAAPAGAAAADPPVSGEAADPTGCGAADSLASGGAANPPAGGTVNADAAGGAANADASVAGATVGGGTDVASAPDSLAGG
jgi:hypothetical protein